MCKNRVSLSGYAAELADGVKLLEKPHEENDEVGESASWCPVLEKRGANTTGSVWFAVPIDGAHGWTHRS